MRELRRALLASVRNLLELQELTTFVDIFAGIGGMRRGGESAGWQCVFTCEWDKYAQQTYRANYGQQDIWGDIHELPADAIPPFDVLLAGFPCQPFSYMGVAKRKGLGQPTGFADETKGTLFFELVRLLGEHKPRAFLLENVRGLVSHDSGRTFRTIRYALTWGLGYNISWRVIPAHHWLPTLRQRIFIVGWRDISTFDLNRMPLPPAPGMVLGEILETDVPARYTISPGWWDFLRSARNRFGYSITPPDGIAGTLLTRHNGQDILVSQLPRPRLLTPRECSRLMGFDGPGESTFKITVSDTQAYRQFGNAVCPPVSGAIAQYMNHWLVGSLPHDAHWQLALEL